MHQLHTPKNMSYATQRQYNTKSNEDRGGLWRWTHKANRLELQCINAVDSNPDEGDKKKLGEV